MRVDFQNLSKKPLRAPILAYRFDENLNEIGQVAFTLALGPHNDNKISEGKCSTTFLGSGDLKTDFSAEKSTVIFLRLQYFLLYII